jgi:hypothetical protein
MTRRSMAPSAVSTIKAMRATALACKYSPKPQARPMAPTTQTAAPVVTP